MGQNEKNMLYTAAGRMVFPGAYGRRCLEKLENDLWVQGYKGYEANYTPTGKVILADYEEV